MGPNIPIRKKNHRLLVQLVVGVLLMFAFGFALVPLYDVLCRVTGLNGKTSGQAEQNYGQVVDKNRVVTVQFVASRHADLPWDFVPLVRQMDVHPGANYEVAFQAKNKSNHLMTVQAVPSITPGGAAAYFKKTECFCFSEQALKPGETIDMPLTFFVAPSLPKALHTITLAYTLFDLRKKDVNKR